MLLIEMLRREAVVGLKGHNGPARCPRFLAVLAADPDRDVRWWAIESLGAIGGPDALGDGNAARAGVGPGSAEIPCHAGRAGRRDLALGLGTLARPLELPRPLDRLLR